MYVFTYKFTVVFRIRNSYINNHYQGYRELQVDSLNCCSFVYTFVADANMHRSRSNCSGETLEAFKYFGRARHRYLTLRIGITE